LITWKPQGNSTDWSTEMTAPVIAPDGAPELDPRADGAARRDAARAIVRAEKEARRAADDRERARKAARQAERRDLRRARRELRAERAADSAYGAGNWVRRAAPVVGAAVPVAMVNGTAFVGQFAYIKDHVPWVLPGQILVAATFESVAVYLAWSAHVAMMRNDSSTRLKLGAQLFALIMGGMNYSHYASHWHPTVLAVGLGLMSLLSPSLWGIYSRRAARDKLMDQGLVEPHAVRLGANRVMWHPVRSVQVMWRATWLGENNPKAAIALYEAHRAERRAASDVRQEVRRAEIESRRTAVPRQMALQPGAPAAAPVAAPAAAPLQPGGARQESGALECPAPAQLSAGPQDVIPGTELNGRPVEVRAIAQLAAPATLGSHEISPEQLAALAEHLDTVPLAQLPSQRKASDLVCADHDHRRQTNPVLKARQAKGDIPAAPLRALRNTSSFIAAPVSTRPGGKQANG
jgi:hypothetical protein